VPSQFTLWSRGDASCGITDAGTGDAAGRPLAPHDEMHSDDNRLKTMRRAGDPMQRLNGTDAP